MITWDEKLNIGVNVIDIEHKELFEKMDEMLNAIKKGEGQEEVVGMLNFLETYILKCFADKNRA